VVLGLGSRSFVLKLDSKDFGVFWNKRLVKSGEFGKKII
jgi:hypothetical protein